MQQQHNNFGHAHISTASQYDDFIMMKEILQVKLILRVFIVRYKLRYSLNLPLLKLIYSEEATKYDTFYDTDM